MQLIQWLWILKYRMLLLLWQLKTETWLQLTSKDIFIHSSSVQECGENSVYIEYFLRLKVVMKVSDEGVGINQFTTRGLLHQWRR